MMKASDNAVAHDGQNNVCAIKKSIRKKIMLTLCFLFIIGGISGLISLLCINNHVIATSDRFIITPEDAVSVKADCILVLGAKVYENGQPSHMLEDRLLQAVDLFKNGASDRLLMSGDHGRPDYDEVNVMKKFAVDMGVPSEKIFMDHAGFSTYESLYRARDIFKVKKIIIVTQRYHLFRALYDAQKLGLEAYGVASDPRTYVGQDAREFREVLARTKDFLYCTIMPKPKYLGEAIPINSNGDLTNDK